VYSTNKNGPRRSHLRLQPGEHSRSLFFSDLGVLCRVLCSFVQPTLNPRKSLILVEPSGIEPLTSTLPVFKLISPYPLILNVFLTYSHQKFCAVFKVLCCFLQISFFTTSNWLKASSKSLFCLGVVLCCELVFNP